MYKIYENIETPNQLLMIIRDMLVDNDWTIMNNCTPDISIHAGENLDVYYPGAGGTWSTYKTKIPDEYYDGLVLAATKDDIILVFRSVNGIPVLPAQNWGDKKHKHQDWKDEPYLMTYLYGVVLTSCTYYTSNPPSGLWYDQPNVLKNTANEVIGVYLPVPKISKKWADWTIDTPFNLKAYIDYPVFHGQKVFINYTNDPEISCVISLECTYYNFRQKEGHGLDITSLPLRVRDNPDCMDYLFEKRYKHLAFCNIEKVGTWNGGTTISATHNIGDIGVTSYNEMQQIKAGTNTVPFEYSIIEDDGNKLYAMANNPSTFCRIDVDGAPLRLFPVLWASAGPSSSRWFTGKILGLPVGPDGYDYPKYPHYKYLCSVSGDYGRNANTLNDITVDLNLFVFILRDPDSMQNYSQIGYIPNVYAISMRNVAPSKIYEIKYPYTGLLHQVFPYTVRKGKFAYDGMAVRQDASLEGDD